MRRVTPKVFLIGETALKYDGLNAYLNYIGTKWKAPQDVSDSEALVEVFGRLCYRSWEPGMNANVTKVREGNKEYIHNILKSRHGSVCEHAQTNWIFADVSRVFTHELVRHRAGCAYSQESLRFVRLTDLGLWLPSDFENDPALVKLFEQKFRDDEDFQRKLAEYLELDEGNFERKKRLTSAMRRAAPDGLSTTIGMSLNMRTLRHLLELRSSPHAEEEIRLVFDQIGEIAMNRWPNLFQDFTRGESADWVPQFSKI